MPVHHNKRLRAALGRVKRVIRLPTQRILAMAAAISSSPRAPAAGWHRGVAAIRAWPARGAAEPSTRDFRHPRLRPWLRCVARPDYSNNPVRVGHFYHQFQGVFPAQPQGVLPVGLAVVAATAGVAVATAMPGTAIVPKQTAAMTLAMMGLAIREVMRLIFLETSHDIPSSGFLTRSPPTY